MRSSDKAKTEFEIEQVLKYAEMHYLILALTDYIDITHIGKRVMMNKAVDFLHEFESYARKCILCRSDESLSLLSDDIMYELLLLEKNSWEEDALRDFMDLCTGELYPDSRNRVYVPSWHSRIMEAVSNQNVEMLYQLDVRRGMLCRLAGSKQRVMSISISKVS